MRQFEAITEQFKQTRNGGRKAEELIRIQFVGTEIVRCKDCKHFVVYYDGVTDCRFIEEKAFAESPLNNLPDDFCSRGERRADATD